MRLSKLRFGVVGVACAMVVGVAASPAWGQCVPAPSGLVSWWPGDGDANDLQSGNDGTLLGGATFDAGRVALTFVFDGASTSGVEVPDADSLDFGPGSDLSIDAWILAFGGCQVQDIVDKRLAPPPSNRAVGYALFLFDGRLGFQLADAPLAPGQFSNFLSSGPNLRDGAFHHVAVTVDRSSSSGGKLYVDGVVVLTFDPTVQPGDLSNNEPLLIGKHPTEGFCGAYRGRIDEVEIFNRALSASEIQDIFNAGSAGKCKGDPDGDGVSDADDVCPYSDLGPTIVIGGDDTGVANQLLDDGCTIADLMAQLLAADASTNVIVQFLVELKGEGIITGRDLGAILRALNSP